MPISVIRPFEVLDFNIMNLIVLMITSTNGVLKSYELVRTEINIYL